ncbi:MAG: S-layer family protein [Stigonema ocellatum SAG 48.90 = DSM 106950]|nr:S-layer family protein [Stigonema ocellatum SAG 48.90 = DSM 106950]
MRNTKTQGFGWFLGIEMAIGCVYVLGGNCAVAEITPDGTLPNNSRVTTQNNIRIIEGGTQAGSNLFHSFREFSVPTNSTAFFNNGMEIQNIISRITGESGSHIDGLIRANGTANLFVINPHGIIFGPNAQLNIGGSFFASTASAIKFSDGFEFSATAPSSTPLLTISVPIGLQFGAKPESIRNQSQVTDSSGVLVGLQVQPGKTLALIGGNVNLDGGNLQASGGRVELGGLASAGTVGLNGDGKNLSLSFPNDVGLADISLTNSRVDVLAGGGGSIGINARNFDLLPGSIILAGIKTGMGTVGSQAGDITINTTGEITISGIAIVNAVQPMGVGNSGDINIRTDSLSINKGAQIYMGVLGKGNAGNLNINAQNQVLMDGGLFINSVGSGSVGNAGNINITTGSLSLTNGGQLIANTQGNGNAGSVTINANNRVSVDGVDSTGNASAVLTTVAPQAIGNAGNINVTAGSLSLTNGGQLIANTQGNGNAGSVTINAKDQVSFDGVGPTGKASAVLTTVDSQAMGKGGDVNITTGSLTVSNGGLLEASTFGKGDAGSVTINAKDQVSFDGVGPKGASAVLTTVASGSVGNGGNINVTAGSLSLTNGARLAANTEGNGNSGNIQVTAANSVSVSGVSFNAGFSSGLFTSTEPRAVGEGGIITVNTPSLQLQNGAIVNAQTLNAYNGGNVMINANTLKATGGGQVLTTTSGSGKAGEITINATDSITLVDSDPTFASRSAKFVGIVRNQSPATGLFSNADANSTGNGGSINLNTNKLNISDQAGISVNSSGKGNAGNLQIQAAGSLNLDQQAFLSAVTVSGKGGNIELQIGSLLLTRHNSQISAKADANGDGGNITINAPLIVAIPQENSDIIANALKGRGGNIQITTQGIFGLQSRSSLTPESDINASSQFGVNGTVQINTLDVNPSRGLIVLPVRVDASSKLIASSCAALNEKTGSDFTITGRGGLPPNPYEPLMSDAIWSDTRLPLTTTHQHQPKTRAAKIKPKPIEIVPATGWVFNGKGEVTLISSVSNTTSSTTPASCPAK